MTAKQRRRRKKRPKRWYWVCHNDNAASDWRDYERCVAISRRGYQTEAEARKAATRHRCPITSWWGHNVAAPHVYRR